MKICAFKEHVSAWGPVRVRRSKCHYYYYRYPCQKSTRLEHAGIVDSTTNDDNDDDDDDNNNFSFSSSLLSAASMKFFIF